MHSAPRTLSFLRPVIPPFLRSCGDHAHGTTLSRSPAFHRVFHDYFRVVFLNDALQVFNVRHCVPQRLHFRQLLLLGDEGDALSETAESLVHQPDPVSFPFVTLRYRRLRFDRERQRRVNTFYVTFHVLFFAVSLVRIFRTDTFQYRRFFHRYNFLSRAGIFAEIALYIYTSPRSLFGKWLRRYTLSLSLSDAWNSCSRTIRYATSKAAKRENAWFD